jgi:hypothetical protein
MKKRNSLSFAVRDTLNGEPISPNNMPVGLLGEFSADVISFLRGSGRPDLKDVRASIKQGSFAIEIEDSVGELDTAFDDYNWTLKHHNLDKVDPVRARIIEKWQRESKASEDRAYELFVNGKESGKNVLEITADTDFKIRKDVWVDVELYVYGQVYDMGGKSKPNVHLKLENGASITIGADTALLGGDKINRLYKRQLVRIRAKQSIHTGRLRDESLVSFEHYEPQYDEDSFLSIVKKGRLAWGSVENATKWVEEMRGHGVHQK